MLRTASGSEPGLLPNSVAVLNANDILPTNADGTLVMVPNSDLFYLSGIEQEETILIISPDAVDPKNREILFVRETSDLIKIWEGAKHTKEEASKISGIRNVKLLSDFPSIFRQLMCDAENVYLNSNEHKRAVVEVETRDCRFAKKTMGEYPLHRFHRLAPILHELRLPKSKIEVGLLKEACRITKKGFERVARKVKPGMFEHEVEAEFAHEFIRNRAKFAYSPIIAGGGERLRAPLSFQRSETEKG